MRLMEISGEYNCEMQDTDIIVRVRHELILYFTGYVGPFRKKSFRIIRRWVKVLGSFDTTPVFDLVMKEPGYDKIEFFSQGGGYWNVNEPLEIHFDSSGNNILDALFEYFRQNQKKVENVFMVNEEKIKIR
jgi:hypothetical protein